MTLLEKLKSQPLSYTRLSAFMTCPRNFQLYYIDRVRPRKRPTYFTIGSAVHAGLENWRQGKPLSVALKAIEEVFTKDKTHFKNAEDLHKLEVDRARADGMVTAYTKHYKDDLKTYDMTTEKEFLFPVCDGWKIMGYIDAIYVDKQDSIYVVENKTTSQVSPDYFTQAKLDYQIALYYAVVQKLAGEAPAGILYDVLLKPSIRLKVKETKKQFQQRVYDVIVKDPAKYLIREHIKVSAKQIKEALRNLRFYVKLLEKFIIAFGDKPWPKCATSCIGKFGSCRYMPICGKNDVIDPFVYEVLG